MKDEITPSRRPNRSLRLTFSYEKDNIRLVSTQRVEMVAPPSDAPVPRENETGFWFELRDSSKGTLYRRVMQNPIKVAFEVRAEPDQPLAWKEPTERRGTFVLLTPDLTAAQTLVLFSSPLEPKGALQPAKEFARFDLRLDPKGQRRG